MSLNKKCTNLLYLFSVLFLIVGITQLILSFYGYQIFLSIKLLGIHSSDQSHIYSWDWETFWKVNHGWSLGITAILSSFFVFKNTKFFWSFSVASCLLLLFGSIFTLYKFQLNIIQYSEFQVMDTGLLIPYKLGLIALSIYGLILLFNKDTIKLFRHIPSLFIKQYQMFSSVVLWHFRCIDFSTTNQGDYMKKVLLLRLQLIL